MQSNINQNDVDIKNEPIITSNEEQKITNENDKTPNNSDTIIQFNELREDESPSAIKNIEVKRDNKIQFSESQIKH